MDKQPTKVKQTSGFFAAKSVVSKKGALMRVVKLELTPRASEQLKANSGGIKAGVANQTPQDCALTD